MRVAHNPMRFTILLIIISERLRTCVSVDYEIDYIDGTAMDGLKKLQKIVPYILQRRGLVPLKLSVSNCQITLSVAPDTTIRMCTCPDELPVIRVVVYGLDLIFTNNRKNRRNASYVITNHTSPRYMLRYLVKSVSAAGIEHTCELFPSTNLNFELPLDSKAVSDKSNKLRISVSSDILVGLIGNINNKMVVNPYRLKEEFRSCYPFVEAFHDILKSFVMKSTTKCYRHFDDAIQKLSSM